MNIVKPSDIDRTLGEVLKDFNDDNTLSLKLNASSKYLIGNSIALFASLHMFNYVTNDSHELAAKIVTGIGLLVIMSCKKIESGVKMLSFVNDFCKRRGLNPKNFTDGGADLYFKDELLNKKILGFDIPEELLEEEKSKNNKRPKI